nr:glycosyltransferase [Sphingobium boeckii]
MAPVEVTHAAGPAPGPSVLLVDPVLFTAPYDAALSRGLKANGVAVHWATRALRPQEEPDLEAGQVSPVFYRMSDGPRRGGNGALRKMLKGFEHMMGLGTVQKLARNRVADLVHFQWSVLPSIDLRAIARIRAERPVVLTVHDLVPFNGKDVNQLQRRGFDAVLRAVDHIIVHTDGARTTLAGRGVDHGAISVIPHGLLPLKSAGSAAERTDRRWRVILFGRLQAYKGLDVLVEAAGRLDPQLRAGLHIIIAGEAMIPLDEIRRRITALGLQNTITLDDRRFSESAMATLLGSADAFVFPYSAIEASGVLHLVAGLEKWIIASDLGVFRDMIGHDGRCGALTSPGDAAALAQALAQSIGRIPAGRLDDGVPGWDEIGRRTRVVYEKVLTPRAVQHRVAA